MSLHNVLVVLSLVVPLLHVMALLCAVDAVMKSRTSQGAIAWSIALITFPYLTLPLYWIFGRSKFHGYVDARRAGDLEIQYIAQGLAAYAPEFKAVLENAQTDYRVLETLAKMPFTQHNNATLLVDGSSAFPSIFEGINHAKDYILVQYFIIHDDGLGRELKASLIRTAKQGIRIYVLYDEIGCWDLPRDYKEDLENAGVAINPFRTTKGRRNRFQLNFRNHRKIVVIDGHSAYVGGLNVGDEYMGRNPKFGHWRDTNVKVEGPSVQCIQLSFIEDWYWSTHTVPKLNWTPQKAVEGNMKVLVLPFGPADELEACGLAFTHALHCATRRIWIASPYFVPDEQMLGALQLASLRGLDVRIMIPQKIDHLQVYLSAFSYFSAAERAGIKIYRYQPGFLHQKVMLIDDDVAAIGTANLDNRSFRLNFEIITLFIDRPFAENVEKMMEDDFANCTQVSAADYTSRPFWFRLAVRVSRLLAPIQ